MLRTSYGEPLLGTMMMLRNPFNDGACELGLGTVTGIQTVNPNMAPNSPFASHVAADTGLEDTAGNDNDTRAVSIAMEAVFRRGGDGEAWSKFSSTLSTSPPTGTEVRALDQGTCDELMADTVNPAYLGSLRGSDVLIPYTLGAFDGPRGARHAVIAGQTGSGKSSMYCYALANDLRIPQMGQIIVDPQGQWTSEHGLPFSLQGLARACGRTVHVARLAENLRLRKDAPLFLQLLTEARWFRQLAFGAGADENVEAARDALRSALEDGKAMSRQVGTTDWTAAQSSSLMRYLLNTLHDVLPSGIIYAGRDQQSRVMRTIYRPETDANGEPLDEGARGQLPPGALDEDGERAFSRLLAPFSALHSLWGAYSPRGLAKLAEGATEAELGAEDKRRDAWSLMLDVMRPKYGSPAAWLILDLSADVAPLAGDGSDESGVAALETSNLLDSTDVKARILKQLMTTLRLAGQQQFASGGLLSTRVSIDEAWSLAGPVEGRSIDTPAGELSVYFAGMARDVRKYGIGLNFITQTPTTGLNDDIYKQCSILYIGHGLHDAADLKKLSSRVSDSHLDLYRASPPPEATGRYPWMLIGGNMTGLSFGSSPVFIEAFNDPQKWLTANSRWITATRREFRHALPAGDTGGPLDAIPGADIDEHVRSAVTAQRQRSAKGNVSAAKAVAAAGRRAPSTTPSPEPESGSPWSTADFADVDTY